MQQKLQQKVFRFLDNCIWIRSRKISQPWIGFLSPDANVLKNTSKISHIDKRDTPQIISYHSDAKIWQMCSHADFTSVWDALTCWLSKDVLKQCFLEIGLTKSLTLCNFGNTLAVTIIFFFKIFKIWCRF